MSIALIAGIAVLGLIVAIAVSQRSRGARVTTIERTAKRDKTDDEEPTQ